MMRSGDTEDFLRRRQQEEQVAHAVKAWTARLKDQTEFHLRIMSRKGLPHAMSIHAEIMDVFVCPNGEKPHRLTTDREKWTRSGLRAVLRRVYPRMKQPVMTIWDE